MLLLQIIFPLSLAYLIGSLPLGSRLIRWTTGKEARAFSAHNLGVENLLYFIGAPVALASFCLDMLKAALALLLFAGSPWAALGVYVGHLWPLPLSKEGLPRGRGNGIIVGIVAAFWALGVLPWWLAALPIVVFALVLALSSYVSLASLSGLAALFVAATQSGVSLTLASSALFVVALWRHKANLLRILDKTEARLGEPPAVHGRDPNTVLAAFMIHPLSIDDLWQPRSLRLFSGLLKQGWLPERLLRRLLLHMRPQVQDTMTGIRLSDGRELKVMLIGGPLLPDQIRDFPDIAVRMAVQGARIAKEQGAEAFGLGAFWSTVGNKGLDVQEAVPEIAMTNGGAYTAASVKAAVPGLLKAFEAEGGSLQQAAAAVVGANGVVAFGVARSIAQEIGALILIGRDSERLERSAKTLRRKFPGTEVSVSTDIAACAQADLIFSATSDPDPVIFPEQVKPGAWIFDLGRPADVAKSVRQVPGVHIIPGGVVKPPGEMKNFLDIHFGDGLVPACMAETMIMTATRSFDKASLGPATKTGNIDFYLREGERLGFEIITRDERVTQVSEALKDE